MRELSNETVVWYSKKEICDACNIDEKTFRRFKKETNLDVKRNLRKGDRNVDYYPETTLKQFQLWLMRNQVNQGVQVAIKDSLRTISDVDGFKYSKEDICDLCKVSETTFKNFLAGQVLDQRNFISVGSSHKKLYNETTLKQFQMWLKRNAMNAGGQRTKSSIVKQDNQQDLFIGCVATKGTPDEIRSLAEHLKVMADQKEQLEIATNTTHQLQLENKQLVEENDYLKKANDFTTAQLGYYKRKYHSYYDDYEIY